MTHRNPGDVKVLKASNGLNTIVEVVSNLALTEEIVLDTAHARLASHDCSPLPLLTQDVLEAEMSAAANALCATIRAAASTATRQF